MTVPISAKLGLGIDELKDAILSRALSGGSEAREGVIVTNVRQKNLLLLCRDSLTAAVRDLDSDKPLEIVALSLRDALQRLGEIVGVVTTDDILNKIFNDFCIGK